RADEKRILHVDRADEPGEAERDRAAVEVGQAKPLGELVGFGAGLVRLEGFGHPPVDEHLQTALFRAALDELFRDVSPPQLERIERAELRRPDRALALGRADELAALVRALAGWRPVARAHQAAALVVVDLLAAMLALVPGRGVREVGVASFAVEIPLQ